MFQVKLNIFISSVICENQKKKKYIKRLYFVLFFKSLTYSVVIIYISDNSFFIKLLFFDY